MALMDEIYAKLPVWGQHAAVTAYGLYWNRLRFGGDYQQRVQAYCKREYLPEQQWHAFQQQRLKELLSYAVERVPYFRETWNRDHKLAARSCRLAELPLLSKEPLRRHPEMLVRDDVTGPRFTFHTSGSSGTPIATIWTASEIRDSIAIREARSARWAGVSFALPRATFSGRFVEPNPNSRGPFHRFNAIEKQLYLSAFHLRADTAARYVDALHKHRVVWMTGYAVSFFLLARFMLEQKLSPPATLRAIVTTSEKLTDAMRDTMQQAYQCGVFEEYGTVENALLVTECERGQLHLNPDSAVMEILREDGTPCPPGCPGEVVVTPLTRTSQILIRYRLGDVATISPEKCVCGRDMPVVKEVLGRIEDVVVGPDGRQMVRFHGVFVSQPNIIEGQIVQEALDLIRVKVVCTPAFCESDENEIVMRVQQRLSSSVHVIVERVESIPRTKSGKFKSVVSMLSGAQVQNT